MAQQNLRARQQQRQRFIIILVLLVLVGAGIFFFINGGSSAKKTSKPRPPGHVAVPVVKKDVALGTRISNKLFTVKFMKPNDVPTDAILSVDEFLGRHTTRPLLEGHYIRQGDVGIDGAVGGFSAMAKPGKRVISLPANLFPGSLETLNVGDHIDLLAFEGTSMGLSAGRKGKSLSDSATTVQGGGSQPGDPNSKARQRARARAGTGNAANATNATLIAENAEVMSVPTGKKKRNRKSGEYLVLQMSPQDAHVTTLMAATSTVMRAVFRPFGDDTRLTKEEPVKITTRFPRSSADPDNIMMIAGGRTYMQRPQSKLFVNEADRDATQDDGDDFGALAPAAVANEGYAPTAKPGAEIETGNDGFEGARVNQQNNRQHIQNAAASAQPVAQATQAVASKRKSDDDDGYDDSDPNEDEPDGAVY